MADTRCLLSFKSYTAHSFLKAKYANTTQLQWPTPFSSYIQLLHNIMGIRNMVFLNNNSTAIVIGQSVIQNIYCIIYIYICMSYALRAHALQFTVGITQWIAVIYMPTNRDWRFFFFALFLLILVFYFLVFYIIILVYRVCLNTLVRI